MVHRKGRQAGQNKAMVPKASDVIVNVISKRRATSNPLAIPMKKKAGEFTVSLRSTGLPKRPATSLLKRCKVTFKISLHWNTMDFLPIGSIG